MTVQMTVNLPPQKARQHLLNYIETRHDMRVRSSEPNSLRVRTLGYRHPWINIRIEILEDGNRTRLAFNFDFRMVYSILAIVLVIGIAFIWVLPQPMIESMILTTIILICASIIFASDINKAKRKFLDDISKAFELLNKTN